MLKRIELVCVTYCVLAGFVWGIFRSRSFYLEELCLTFLGVVCLTALFGMLVFPKGYRQLGALCFTCTIVGSQLMLLVFSGLE